MEASTRGGVVCCGKREGALFIGGSAGKGGRGQGASPVGWLEAASNMVFLLVPVPQVGTGMAPTRSERVLVLVLVRVPCLNPFLLSSSLLLSLMGDPLLVPFFPTISLSVSVSLRSRGLIAKVIVSI